MTVVLYGGAFDPPHRGHVELARAAKRELGVPRLHVLVAAAPGHKRVSAPAEARLALARAAFPDDDVVLDEHARTIEALRAHPEWHDPIFLIGADEFSDFPSWQEPAAVLERARLAVATRPGFPRERLQAVLARLAQPERVLFFDMPPTPVASTELRGRLERGEPVDGDVPPAVAALIRARGLYGDRGGYTQSD